MKSTITYIKEALRIKSGTKIVTGPQYNYHPKYGFELIDLMEKLIKERGNEGDFNDIDTSEITDMNYLFQDAFPLFNGDISGWDVSNVTTMTSMFQECHKFEGKGLNNWNVSKVTNMENMFENCLSFNQDISNWNVSNVKYMDNMFNDCPIKAKYIPKFK